MKKIILLAFAVCSVMLLSFTNSDEIKLPEYSAQMYSSLEDCSCSGMFSSCSGSGNCTCTCGYFTCSCTSNPKDPAPIGANIIDISISPEQYINIERLWEKLNTIGANEAMNHLANLIEGIKDQNPDKFQIHRIKYFESLDSLNSIQKSILNDFFISIGAEERV